MCSIDCNCVSNNPYKNNIDMKANAPERLYLSKTIYSTYLYQVPDPDDETAIEYTRTDAFIKKACDFFEENIEEEDCKIGSSEWVELRAEYKSLDSFIRAFVEYMKGE